MKYFLIAVVLVLPACDSDGDGRYFETTTACYSDPGDLAYVIEQLGELVISYNAQDDPECVKYNSEGDLTIELSRPIQISSDYERYPDNFAPGRSTSWEERNSELVEILESNGIPHDSYVVDGLEWVSWNLEDVEKVEELLGYSEFLKKNSKETRESFPRFNAPNN